MRVREAGCGGGGWVAAGATHPEQTDKHATEKSQTRTPKPIAPRSKIPPLGTPLVLMLKYFKICWKACGQAANPRRSNFQSASNLVLIADLESTQNSVKIRPKIIDFRSFCVELWPKQVLHRISVPMSYISLWEWQKVVPQWPFAQYNCILSRKSVPQGPFGRIKLCFYALTTAY